MKWEKVGIKLEKLVKDPHDKFSNAKPQIEISAFIDEGEAPSKVLKTIKTQARRELEKLIEEELEAFEKDREKVFGELEKLIQEELEAFKKDRDEVFGEPVNLSKGRKDKAPTPQGLPLEKDEIKY